MTQPNDDRQLSVDAHEEIRQHNDYARATFSQFVTWWAFFVTSNLTVATLLLQFGNQLQTYLLIAWVVFFLDVVGASFCLLVSLTLVQINDRIIEIASRRSPDQSPLGNPARIQAMFSKAIKWWSEPTRTASEYNSPVPLSFYLWCTMPTILSCLLVSFAWFYWIFVESSVGVRRLIAAVLTLCVCGVWLFLMLREKQSTGSPAELAEEPSGPIEQGPPVEEMDNLPTDESPD